MPQAETVKPVVFYSWIEDQPASTVHHIGGSGERRADAQGKIIATPTKMVRFASGKLRTSDPEVIDVMRAMIERGETITEDEELYLSKVMSPEKQAKRLTEKNAELIAENSRLKAALQGKAAAGDKPSKVKGLATAAATPEA